ncbi:MAG: cell division ATP-binding protein FtsE [Eubacteriales bacterium]|nr:cell division ATP-binding protein FtsE [Eubacteriales bacterium]
MIMFNNVSMQYSETNEVALNKVNFLVEKGEFVFIIGASGAGKSTITHLITREIQPTEGTILINGKDTSTIKRRQIPYFRRNIGMVFQDFRLLESKTVYENVAFALEITGTSSKQIRRIVPNVLGMVGLSAKANVMPNQLSGGEMQRVALARAMANDPGLLIADEPTGNLDPTNAEEIMKILLDINKHGTTILVVTHDVNTVNRMKQRVIEIQNGIIVRDEQEGSYVCMEEGVE